MGTSVLSFIMAMQEAEHAITRDEFAEIRRNGTEEELIKAVERMDLAGGYDNLD